MERGLEERIERRARAQHGLITRGQLAKEGATSRQIDARLKRGDWQVLRAGLYGLPGRAPGWPSAVMAAVLAAGEGAVASHRAAASLLGFPNVVRRLDVTVPAERRVHLPELVVYRSRRLHVADLKPIQGIPATAPARTIIDLTSLYDRGRIAAILDAAAARRLLSRRDLVEALARATPGRRIASGLEVIQGLLDERPEGKRPLGSDQERRLLGAIRAAGLPEPETQRRVVIPNGRVLYLDYAWDQYRFGVELISYRWHGDLQSFGEDAEREAELVALGWAVLRTTAQSVQYDLRRVVSQIARGLAARRVAAMGPLLLTGRPEGTDAIRYGDIA